MRGRHALKMGAEMQIIHTEVMDINPVYGLQCVCRPVQQADAARSSGRPPDCTIANDTASYNLADFMFGLPSQVQLANWLVGNYRQRALLPVPAGRFPRELETHAESRAALGICDAALGARQRALQLRSRHQLA